MILNELNKSIDYIDENVTEELSLLDISKRENYILLIKIY